MKNKILILGAGNAQYDAIKYCKEMGYEVHSLSYTNTDKSIPLCDYFEQINITDTDKVCEYAKDKNVDIIYSVGSDIAMPTALKVSEILNKPRFIDSKVAEICNTKNSLREELGSDFEGNLKHIIAEKIEDLNEVDFFPVMLKPVDSQGQRGVFRCDNMNQLLDNFEKSIQHSRGKKCIIEQFVEGNEISVNAYMVDGSLEYFLISDRISFDEFPGGIIKEHLVPSKYLDGQTDLKIYSLCERVLKKLQILNGPAYFQIMVSKEKEPYLIEVTPRLDGCHMWNLINHYEEVNLLEATFNHLLFNIKPKIERKENNTNMKLHFMCQQPNTEFVRASFKEGDDYRYIRWYYKNGDNVRVLNGFMEKCGYYID